MNIVINTSHFYFEITYAIILRDFESFTGLVGRVRNALSPGNNGRKGIIVVRPQLRSTFVQSLWIHLILILILSTLGY